MIPLPISGIALLASLLSHARRIVMCGVSLIVCAGCGSGDAVTEPSGPPTPRWVSTISPGSGTMPVGFSMGFIAADSLGAPINPRDNASWFLSNDSTVAKYEETVADIPGCCFIAVLVGNRPGTVLLTTRTHEVNSAPITVTVTPREQWASVSLAEHACGATVSGLGSCWDQDPRETYYGYSENLTAPRMPRTGFPKMKSWGGQCGLTLDKVWVCKSCCTNIVDTLFRGTTFETVSTGLSKCAISETGTTYCTACSPNCSGVQTSGQVMTTELFTAISMSSVHQCATNTAGKAYCWGSNASGQLGTSSQSTTCATSPCEVAGGYAFSVITVGGTSSGNGISCGVVSPGESYCWGAGANAPWRAGLAANNGTPSRVEGDPGFVSLATASDHVCGLTSAGDAYCWGKNDRGQLGLGFISTANAPPLGPQPVVGNLKFRSISTSPALSCGLTTGGDIYCWGNAAKIGDRTFFCCVGSVDIPDVPTPRRVGG